MANPPPARSPSPSRRRGFPTRTEVSLQGKELVPNGTAHAIHPKGTLTMNSHSGGGFCIPDVGKAAGAPAGTRGRFLQLPPCPRAAAARGAWLRPQTGQFCLFAVQPVPGCVAKPNLCWFKAPACSEHRCSLSYRGSWLSRAVPGGRDAAEPAGSLPGRAGG